LENCVIKKRDFIRTVKVMMVDRRPAKKRDCADEEADLYTVVFFCKFVRSFNAWKQAHIIYV